MNQPTNFALMAIPLNRPEIVEFLLNHTSTPRGAPLYVLGQRPTGEAEVAWIRRLLSCDKPPTVEQLLEMDDPHTHLVQSWSDRLVPVPFLREPEFLTRNLGGWAPIYFAVAGWAGSGLDRKDPLWRHAEILHEYGAAIRYFGASPAQVASRLEEELGADLESLVSALGGLLTWRVKGQRIDYIERLYATLHGENRLGEAFWPKILLFDELMNQLVCLELARRDAIANGEPTQAAMIQKQQDAWKNEYGLRLILKGEYIVGRHRRSTVLIVPELGVVVKQPAPEPFHEIELAAKKHDGQAENWPRPTEDGALVTARGRIRLVIEENLVPRLAKALSHRINFSALFGLSVEDFVKGPTVQQLILQNPRRMTPDLYDELILTQQVCELLDGENGDWHSANFVVRQKDEKIIHIDWGAARPLTNQEHTPSAKLARLNQVQNLAFSFHDDDIAKLVRQRHTELIADQERLTRIQQRAQALADKVSNGD